MRFFQGSHAAEYWFREGCHIAEWTNDAGSPELSIARARVAPGATTRWHALHEITERYVILSGRGRADIGEQHLDVAPGDVIVIEPGEAQRISASSDEELVFLAICTPRFRPGAYRELEFPEREP